MADLIDRDGLLKPMTEFREFLLEKEYYEPSIDTWATLRDAVEIFIKHIEEQPTVTQTNTEFNAESALIERKEGLWVEHRDYPGLAYLCSICGYFTTVKSNYCPHCGKMMGGGAK